MITWILKLLFAKISLEQHQQVQEDKDEEEEKGEGEARRGKKQYCKNTFAPKVHRNFDMLFITKIESTSFRLIASSSVSNCVPIVAKLFPIARDGAYWYVEHDAHHIGLIPRWPKRKIQAHSRGLNAIRKILLRKKKKNPKGEKLSTQKNKTPH